MPQVNFPQIEEEMLEYWKKNKIFEKSLKKNKKSGKNFIFYEGPPTANGKPGIHHVLARAFKDLIPRYKTMQGFQVDRKAGWDTHGLPVELQIEKKLKISGKQQIENIVAGDKFASIKKFNEECQKSVWQYKEDWEKMTDRIAFWLDMEDPYITYTPEYVDSLWWVFKQIWDKGLLYKGHKVVPHCPRCGTALSSHELAQGYKEVTEKSIYIKFKVKNLENTYILSWTTTPWTLPGNVALAVGEDIVYVKVKQGNESLIIAKNLLNKLEGEYEVEGAMLGNDLVNYEYEPLFPDAVDAGDKKAWFVTAADFVTIADGTGVVHTAVMYGEDDYNLGKQIGLPTCHTVNEDGTFKDSVKGLGGKFVKHKDTEKQILEHLKKNNLLYKEEQYTHDYPFCWRCDTPLIYYAKDSWFIKMTQVKKELIANNEDIGWHPSYIKEGRFGEWLREVKDWAISRERYWGTPLPIWECQQCDKQECLGSKQEIETRSGQKLNDVHRPFIDKVKIKCKCGADMIRVQEVADCWFDSGCMPYAQWGHPYKSGSKKMLANNYPADYISEAIDQTRGWFYTLLAVSTVLGKGTCYKHCICLGHILDKHGKKMSKSKGNVVDPWEVINEFGADALRLHLYTVSQPGSSKNFDVNDVKKVMRRNFMTLWNILSFYKMFAADLKPVTKQPKTSNVLDKWVLAKLNELIQLVTASLDAYKITKPGRAIMDFIAELSTWYLRRSRARFKGDDAKDKQAALETLSYCLYCLTKLMAPFTPFISEKLYQELNADKESVHLEDWPKVNKRSINNKLLANMDAVREAVEKGLALREQAGIKVRQPLASLTVADLKVKKELLQLIEEEVNVKQVKLGKEFKLDTELTPELEEEGIVRELIRAINGLRKKNQLTINDKAVVIWQTESSDLKQVIENNADELKKSTRTIEFKKGSAKTQVKINGESILLDIEKI